MSRKGKYFISILLVLGAILVSLIVTKTKFYSHSEPLETKVYGTSTGYGYTISFDDKVLIKQDFIPSIQNNQSFCSYDDAQKIANLVQEKLYKKENPKITLLELKQLHIKFNCIN